MGYYASKVVSIALAEVGYLEKATNSSLDSKTDNAGYKNYTKYSRDLDNISGFYNGKKNGTYWCTHFVDWCFVKAFGVAEAKARTYHTTLGASATLAAARYQDNKRWFSTPQIGDEIFFGKKSDCYHTGIVVDVDGIYVYTVEGNTSAGSGVIDNGGGVAKKKYKITDSAIAGYGRPLYDVAVKARTKPLSTKANSSVNQKVRLFQNAAIADGFKSLLPSGADGVWGKECEVVAKKNCVYRRTVGYKYKNLTLVLQKCLGLSGNDLDGKFGGATQKALKTFQKNNGLTVDGVAGLNTWKKLLGVK